MTATSPKVRCEDPVLSFARYGIVFHFPVVPSQGSRPLSRRGCHKIESFERDILAYAYRDAEVPFSTTVFKAPQDLATLTVEMPAELTFTSEGKDVRLRMCCSDVDGLTRRRMVRLIPSRTDFEGSEVSVLHVGLSPERQEDGEEAAPKSLLNEYDVVKLIKLWEGGERDLSDAQAHEPWLVFRSESDEDLSIVQIARKLLGGGEELMKRGPENAPAFVVGTVQLLSDEIPSLLEALRTFRQEPIRVSDNEKTRQGLFAVGGLVQGLIDFTEVDPGELFDVLAGVDVSEVAAVTLQKGTLLSLAAEDRAFKVARDWTAVSPYLLLPHAVLLHDEACLRRARETKPDGHGLRAAHVARDRIDKLLEEDVLGGNVFHYPAERKLYESAYASRGLNRLEQRVRSQLHDLELQIKRQSEERQGMAADLITLLLFVLTVLTIKDVVPLEIGLPVAFVLAVAYMGLRRYFFHEGDPDAAPSHRRSKLLLKRRYLLHEDDPEAALRRDKRAALPSDADRPRTR